MSAGGQVTHACVNHEMNAGECLPRLTGYVSSTMAQHGWMYERLQPQYYPKFDKH